MAITDQIAQLVTPAVEAQGFFLEEVLLVSPGKHRIVTCIVDGQSSLNMDQVTAISRAISELLDEAVFMGEAPFTLEVTSPGVDRPLTKPRHFAKNVDRLLKVVGNDGEVVTGRISGNTESDLTLSVTGKKEVKEVVIALSDIKRATVEIEFNRKESDK
ncbi:MAG: ribosome maturation factor RimP [Candidatus Planktophila sp.]|nr:ribosome maturation factor RimP [Candidatus Planktophila sp.]MSO24769.1 ribosome maturation factor RimP [Candidatus Planktophila sp.]PHX70236.1 MAG: ribosome maturation factor RimP [Actinomycetota bacterium]